MEAESWQALDWLRKGVGLFGESGFRHADGELWRGDQPIFQMGTTPARLQPDLRFLVRQVNESGSDQPGDSSIHRTTPDILGAEYRRGA
jgi:hypothetical protein